MAAVRLKPGQSFDGQSLYAFTRDTLPIYAAPRFVRIQVSPGALQVWLWASLSNRGVDASFGKHCGPSSLYPSLPASALVTIDAFWVPVVLMLLPLSPC